MMGFLSKWITDVLAVAYLFLDEIEALIINNFLIYER
jgi:hypothetical protein